jgi:hypothetical protein
MHVLQTDSEQNHPRLIAHKIIEAYGTDFDFEFSYYTYKKNTIEDIRTTFKVAAKKVTEQSLIDICNATPDGNNLAFHSTVYFDDGSIRHIPMVDLATKGVGVISKVLTVLPSELANKMIWFESGRSFHGYGTHLIDSETWTQLMGRLLLVNQPQQQPIVDPRWIGHRIIAGYSALRWTKNTNDYIQIPKLVKNVHLISQK